MARRVDDTGSAAPMNFYQRQDRARRKTVVLLGYFLAAVAAITASVDMVVYFITQAGSPSGLPLMTWLTSDNGLAVSAAVAASIGAGTAYTSLRLSGGGQAVALLVGARRIAPATPDARAAIAERG